MKYTVSTTIMLKAVHMLAGLRKEKSIPYMSKKDNHEKFVSKKEITELLFFVILFVIL